MNELFALEWMGGVAEHHFRKARPDVGEFAWETLDPAAYSATAVAAAQQMWTDIALSEYAAITGFSEVVSALALARAPLDLIGMTSDFLADEVRHVELASRLLMRLGGAAPRLFDPRRFSLGVPAGLTPLQHANELALRIGCIAEAFATGTAVPVMKETTHPLVRAVYTSILRDEARHRRFGSLYFEWAEDQLDDAERRRLSDVATSSLARYAQLWRTHRAPQAASSSSPSAEEIRQLGWIEPSRYPALAIHVVCEQIIPALNELGIIVDPTPFAEPASVT